MLIFLSFMLNMPLYACIPQLVNCDCCFIDVGLRRLFIIKPVITKHILLPCRARIPQLVITDWNMNKRSYRSYVPVLLLSIQLVTDCSKRRYSSWIYISHWFSVYVSSYWYAYLLGFVSLWCWTHALAYTNFLCRLRHIDMLIYLDLFHCDVGTMA